MCDTLSMKFFSSRIPPAIKPPKILTCTIFWDSNNIRAHSKTLEARHKFLSTFRFLTGEVRTIASPSLLIATERYILYVSAGWTPSFTFYLYKFTSRQPRESRCAHKFLKRKHRAPANNTRLGNYCAARNVLLLIFTRSHPPLCLFFADSLFSSLLVPSRCPCSWRNTHAYLGCSRRAWNLR